MTQEQPQWQVQPVFSDLNNQYLGAIWSLNENTCVFTWRGNFRIQIGNDELLRDFPTLESAKEYAEQL